MKLLLVGPSAKIGEYNIEYFRKKKEDGFEILAYSGAVHYFKDIGFKPDYFSFIDPYTISHNVDFFEKDPFLNRTNLLIADLYRDEFKGFFEKGFTCNNLQLKKDLFERVKTLKFFKNFKNVFASKMKRVTGRLDPLNSEKLDFAKELLFISGKAGENADKFICFLMPLVFYFFKDLKEIKTLAFGDFSLPRHREQIEGREGKRGYDEFIETAERNIPLIKFHLKERDIKFSSETNNFFSERLR